MKLIKFEDTKGNDIWINPDHIRYINDGVPGDEPFTCMNMVGCFVYVKGTPEEVVQRIWAYDGCNVSVT